MIRSHEELDVYQPAFDAAMRIFELSKEFPPEERYSLTDQIRRASRSVCTNISEGWRKRRYVAAFRSKLNDAEGEAAEKQVWVRFAAACGYVAGQTAEELHQTYNTILAKLVSMIVNPSPWILKRRS